MISVYKSLIPISFVWILCFSACHSDKNSSNNNKVKQKSASSKTAETENKEAEELQWEDPENEVVEKALTKEVAPESKLEKEPLKKPKKKATKKAKKKYAKIEFDTLEYNFGTITEGDTIAYKFEFINAGKIPLDIVSADATCGCTRPSFPFIPIEPGDTGFIGVKYISIGKEGNQSAEITIKSNGSPQPTTLTIKGFVEPKKEKLGLKRETAIKLDSLSPDTLPHKGN